MDLNPLIDKIVSLRDEVLFFWQNPATLKTELQSNPQLLLEFLVAVIVFIILVYMLFKPISKTETAEQKKIPEVPKAAPSLDTPKMPSKSLAEHQQQEPSLRPSLPPLKKVTPPNLQELSEEEEQALAQAMSAAGKQALAEASGEPHQAEIFQDTQALDAAKKFFSGQSRALQDASLEEESKALSPLEFVMIYFMAPRSQAFEGTQLFDVLRNLGLTLNGQRVFEYADSDGPQFYVTSAIKPGQFDVQRLNQLIPGVSFVLDLKSVSHAPGAFNKMLATIHELSQHLKGDILDEQRQRLTQSSIHQYMARVKAAR